MSIDFKRAFETVSRSMFLQKCQKYGFTNQALKWFENYFDNRKQKTKIENLTSSELNNDIGIPQGAVLSCFLFIIYINDIKQAIQYSKINLFADDSTIAISCSDLNDGLNKINIDLKNLTKWICANKLSLNVNKTKAMIITKNGIKKIKELKDAKQIEIKIGDELVEIVDEIKLLGVIIDDQLKFDSHLEYLCKKMLKKFYVLKRCDKKMNCYSKILFYKSLISPHVDYCSTILFLFSDAQINEIQKIQNRAMRLILKMDNRTHINDMLDMLQWLSVKQRIYANTLKFIHRVENGEVPLCLQRQMTLRHNAHRHNLRNNNEYQLMNFRTSFAQNSLFHKGLRIYNDFKKTNADQWAHSSNENIRKEIVNYVKLKFNRE